MKMRIWKPTVYIILALVVLCPAFLTACQSVPEEVLPSITLWQQPKTTTDGIPAAAAEPDPDGVQFLGAGMAEEGGMVIVRFNGPAKLTQGWGQGSIYVVDEATGIGYTQIAVAPVLGPLFAKPGSNGAPGYVLLNNPAKGIRTGSVITAVLGKYKRLHVTVK